MHRKYTVNDSQECKRVPTKAASAEERRTGVKYQDDEGNVSVYEKERKRREVHNVSQSTATSSRARDNVVHDGIHATIQVFERGVSNQVPHKEIIHQMRRVERCCCKKELEISETEDPLHANKRSRMEWIKMDRIDIDTGDIGHVGGESGDLLPVEKSQSKKTTSSGVEGEASGQAVEKLTGEERRGTKSVWYPAGVKTEESMSALTTRRKREKIEKRRSSICEWLCICLRGDRKDEGYKHPT